MSGGFSLVGSFLQGFFFLLGHAACGILVPQPGFKPMPPAVDTWSFNHWTTGEVPHYDYWSVVSIWRVLREVFWVNGGLRPLRRLIKLRELLLRVETEWRCIAKVRKELVTSEVNQWGPNHLQLDSANCHMQGGTDTIIGSDGRFYFSLIGNLLGQMITN